MSATYLEVGPAVHKTFNIIPEAVLLMTAPIITSPVFTFYKIKILFSYLLWLPFIIDRKIWYSFQTIDWRDKTTLFASFVDFCPQANYTGSCHDVNNY